MSNNLPLIPGKRSDCTDVHSVLRTVFQELDFLPPLSIKGKPLEKTNIALEFRTPNRPDGDHWPEKYESECKKMDSRENVIKYQRGKRISQKPLPNIFKLHERKPDKPFREWRLDKHLLERKDLIPTIEHNASGDGNLWIKNIFNVSSCDVSTTVINAPPQDKITALESFDDTTLQTLSIGQFHVEPRPPRQVSPAPLAAVSVEHVICVPTELNFTDCSVGRLYVRHIRLINISKFELRLSITPPKHNEFKVFINSPRGLILTSGTNMDLSVQLTPTDQRTLIDTIRVRVSSGQAIVIPIAGLMQRPILDIGISTTNSSLTPSPEQLSFVSTHYEPNSTDDTVELGARLLGDVHCLRVLLQCDIEDVKFFILTEDAWIDWNLNCLTTRCSVVGDAFVFWPAWFCGGGVVKACVWCCGDTIGIHETALRILSSTSICRQLTLLADVLYFRPQHLFIEAHDKDFDICSDDDPACKYYVNLGTAFPHRSVCATIKLTNCSPIEYSFYWDVRRWGICSCWEEKLETQGSSSTSDDSSKGLCPGAKDSKHIYVEDPDAYAKKMEHIPVVQVKAPQEQILADSTCLLKVHVPDVGEKLGVQRSVLRLIVKNIPKKSFPADSVPIILKTTETSLFPIPGIQESVREMCEVLVAEMEVWWEVVPVRFGLLPPVIPLYHSRRLTSMNVDIGVWQLSGRHKVRVSWVTPARVATPQSLSLSTAHCLTTCFNLPLPSLPNQNAETDVFRLEAENNEWKEECVVSRQCNTRQPTLQPPNVWLGIVVPKTHVQNIFTLKNDTFQQIRFWSKAFYWCGEKLPGPECIERKPCQKCMQIACRCRLLLPGHGTLAQGESTAISYNAHAPMRDGCVATLLQVRRCGAAGNASIVHDAAATEARAALVACRVLAPRVVLQLLPCAGPRESCGSNCELDASALDCEGTSTLRPRKALMVGRSTCYRLRVTNVTPHPANVYFNKPIDGTDFLKATFIPKNLIVRSYGKVEIKVILSALKVCERRLFVYRVEVTKSNRPSYLVVDAAIVGVEVSIQVPIGASAPADEFVIMRRTQREERGTQKRRRSDPLEVFLAEDQKRAFVKVNRCGCHIVMQYIPPVKRPSPPLRENEYPPLEIVTEIPPLTPVCCCFRHTKPFIPEPPESISLEFINVPLRKVCERRVILRNESMVTAHWSTSFRRWPRQRKRTINRDKWADGVCESGVALACRPTSGILASFSHIEIVVQVYSDCWGLYRDQLLIQVDDVEPIVLDVWIHVEGPPLQFKIQPEYMLHNLPTMWFSSSDSTRSLKVKNVSRSELVVHAYVTSETKLIQDVLPFRLYIRLYEVLLAPCPCAITFDSGSSEDPTTTPYMGEEVAVELYLAADRGLQDDTYYNVTPEVCTIKVGESIKWEVTVNPPPSRETVPDGNLMLRLMPLHKSGDNWYRDEPVPQLVQLRHVAAVPQVKLSCDEVVVKISALDLPYGDFLRIRKRFQMVNVGSDSINVSLQTCFPWCVVQGQPSHNVKECECGFGCEDLPRYGHRNFVVTKDLPPRSSTEVCVEVCISTMEAWPHGAAVERGVCAPPQYAPLHRETTSLFVFDDNQVLLTLPLIVDMEYPEIKTNPQCLDFGYVTEGDSQKTYVSISHTSHTKTLNLAVEWSGPEEFKLWPHYLEVPPGNSKQVYVQYTANWRQVPAEGCLLVYVCGKGADTDAPSGWCRAALRVRAAPVRDHRWRAGAHDHTDDDHLLPESVQQYLP